MSLYLAAAAMLVSAFISSEEPDNSSPQPQYHRVYAGAEAFFAHTHDNSASPTGILHWKQNGIFGGLRMGYEYFKPQAFYFGTDLLIGTETTILKCKYYYNWNYFPLSNYLEIPSFHSKSKNTAFLANLEQRYGYTFKGGVTAKSTLAPFAGVGWYHFIPLEQSSSINWWYANAGLRVNQQFYERFDVGFNLKAMYGFTGKMKGAWGYEFALPLTWYMGEQKRWDIEFQPYLLKLDSNTSGQILGVRLEGGFHY